LAGLAAALFVTPRSLAAFSLDLVGLDKNDSTNWGPNSPWMGQNLQDWKELDFIPVRIEIEGDAATDELLTFNFSHTFGFQNLYFLSNSPNVRFEAPPMLIAPFGADDWTYNLRVTKTDGAIGFVYFYARLAAGAHFNTGSSLHLDGPTFQPLQIHKPAAGPGNPDCAITKTGPATAAPGSVITYTLHYTNKAGVGITAASGVQVTDVLPPLLSYVEGSASGGGTLAGNVITWDVLDLPAGGSGTFTFQARVATNATSGAFITNSAAILCAEDDANLADNFTQFVTTVAATPVILECAANKTVEFGTSWDFDAPTVSGGCNPALSLEVVSTITNAVEGACEHSFTVTRTWRASDICGNTAECSQTVTVRDTTRPEIQCAPDRVVELGTEWSFTEPTATDLGGGPVTIAIVSTVTNRTEANCGDTFSATRTWSATDVCGHSNTCSQTVTVIDTTPPAVVCSPNKTVEFGTAWTFDPPIILEPNVTVTIVSTVTNTSEATCGNTFSATRVWQATDLCTNSSYCTQVVTVVDTTMPVVTCAPDKTVEIGTPWSFDPPVATDIAGDVSITVLSTTTNRTGFCGNTFAATRVWAVRDMCGNTLQCSQTVTVRDTTPPAVTIILPTNGSVFLAPATFTIVADASDANGVEYVTFYSGETALGTVSNAPFFLVVSNFAVGEYALRAVAGDLCSFTTTSAVVNIQVVSNPPIIALGPIVLNRQNGLFEQSVRVLNPTPFAWPNGLRIYISDLAPTNRVWNADGTNNGLPYVEDTALVAAGGSRDFLIQYYVPNPRVTPTNTLTAVPNPAPAEAMTLALEPALPLTNGKFCVEFVAEDRRIYFVQRTHDWKHWTTVSGPLVGTGERMQWFDNAVPGTCFYRAVCLP